MDMLFMLWAAAPSSSDFVEAEESGVAWVLIVEAREPIPFPGFTGRELTIMQSSSESSRVAVLWSCDISERSVDGMRGEGPD